MDAPARNSTWGSCDDSGDAAAGRVRAAAARRLGGYRGLHDAPPSAPFLLARGAGVPRRQGRPGGRRSGPSLARDRCRGSRRLRARRPRRRVARAVRGSRRPDRAGEEWCAGRRRPKRRDLPVLAAGRARRRGDHARPGTGGRPSAAARRARFVRALDNARALAAPFRHLFFPRRGAGRGRARHDGSEAVDSAWLRPDSALADAAAGSRPILFPTRATLSKLARSRSVAEAIESASAFPVRPVSTSYVKRDGRTVMRIPDDLGYTFTEMPARD